MTDADPVPGLSRWRRTMVSDGTLAVECLERGDGPGVILLPEIPGIMPSTLDLGDLLVEHGVTVVMPSRWRSSASWRSSARSRSISEGRSRTSSASWRAISPCVPGLRFTRDRTSDDAKLATLERHLGRAASIVRIPSGADSTDGTPIGAHSVLTVGVREDPPNGAFHERARMVEFLRERLAPSEASVAPER